MWKNRVMWRKSKTFIIVVKYFRLTKNIHNEHIQEEIIYKVTYKLKTKYNIIILKIEFN